MKATPGVRWPWCGKSDRGVDNGRTAQPNNACERRGMANIKYHNVFANEIRVQNRKTYPIMTPFWNTTADNICTKVAKTIPKQCNHREWPTIINRGGKLLSISEVNIHRDIFLPVFSYFASRSNPTILPTPLRRSSGAIHKHTLSDTTHRYLTHMPSVSLHLVDRKKIWVLSCCEWTCYSTILEASHIVGVIFISKYTNNRKSHETFGNLCHEINTSVLPSNNFFLRFLRMKNKWSKKTQISSMGWNLKLEWRNRGL